MTWRGRSLRAWALMIVASDLLIPAGVHAQAPASLDPAQCKSVAVIMGQVFEALPPDTLSAAFRQSATGFIKSTNACTSPYLIEVTTDADAKAFADLCELLMRNSQPVNLRSAVHVSDRRTASAR